MSLHDKRLPSLRDKHRELLNQELKEKTEELKKDTEKNKVESKKKKK